MRHLRRNWKPYTTALMVGGAAAIGEAILTLPPYTGLILVVSATIVFAGLREHLY